MLKPLPTRHCSDSFISFSNHAWTEICYYKITMQVKQTGNKKGWDRLLLLATGATKQKRLGR